MLIQTGTLRQGDAVDRGQHLRARAALEDSTGKRIRKAGPASAVVLLGLAAVPEAGDILRVVESEKQARAIVEERMAATAAQSEATGHATLEDLYRQVQAGQTKELRIVLKSDVQGSLGAVVHALEQIQTDEVRFNFLLQGTGDITDNDVNLAAASDAVVVGFNVASPARRAGRPSRRASRSASTTSSTSSPRTWRPRSRACSSPRSWRSIQGRAEVRQVFRVGRGQAIAGSYVTDGRIVRGGARVYRNGQLIATDRIASVRRFKDDVREVTAGLRVRHRAGGLPRSSRSSTSSSRSRRRPSPGPSRGSP